MIRFRLSQSSIFWIEKIDRQTSIILVRYEVSEINEH
jgi:hypothetical protein